MSPGVKLIININVKQIENGFLVEHYTWSGSILSVFFHTLPEAKTYSVEYLKRIIESHE